MLGLVERYLCQKARLMIGHSVLVIRTKEKQMLMKRTLTTHLKKKKKKKKEQNKVQASSKTALRGLEHK